MVANRLLVAVQRDSCRVFWPSLDPVTVAILRVRMPDRLQGSTDRPAGPVHRPHPLPRDLLQVVEAEIGGYDNVWSQVIFEMSIGSRSASMSRHSHVHSSRRSVLARLGGDKIKTGLSDRAAVVDGVQVGDGLEVRDPHTLETAGILCVPGVHHQHSII